MAFPKGNNYAKNNPNVGTKTKYEFAAEVLNNGLANCIHNEELVKLKNKPTRTLDEMKILVTPVTVKGIVGKSEISIGARIAGTDLDKLLDYAENEKNQRLPEDKGNEQENKDLSGRDIGEQDL